MDTTARSGATKALAIGTALGLALVAMPLQAPAQMTGMEQDTGIPPISIGVRGGFNFPNDDFAEATLEGGGASFGIDAAVGITDALSAYANWQNVALECDDTVCPDEEGIFEVSSQGFGVGLKYGFFTQSTVGPWVSAGALVHKFESETEAPGGGPGDPPTGDLPRVETDHQLGFEAGLGADIPLSRHFMLVPAIRFGTYDASADVEGPTFSDQLTWFQGDLGFQVTFGG